MNTSMVRILGLRLPCCSAAIFGLILMVAPSLSWGQACNPLNQIVASDFGPLVPPSGPITITLEIGANQTQPNQGTAQVDAVQYALDCENGGLIPCIDDTEVVSYLGDATISTDCTDGVNPVTFTSNVPAGGSATNDLTFTPNNPVVVPWGFSEVSPGTSCSISFDVQILTHSTDNTPEVVESASTFSTDCEPGGEASAFPTLQISVVAPSIDILKEVSVDGGTTWFDANDAGSAPSVTFPSGALYRLTIENTGSVNIDNVVVNDATLGIMNFAVGTLTPGQVVVLTQAEIPALSVAERCSEAGEFENVAQVSGDPDATGAEPVNDDDPAWLVCTGTPGIAIVKEISVDGGTTWFDANDAGSAPVVTFPSGALYRLTVENTGTITLENVVVNDATLGIVNYAVGTLTPGQVVVLTQAEIPELSVAERCGEAGEFENVAEASGAVVGGPTAMDQDPAFLVCEEEPVQFRVVKDFSDDNPAGVEVFIECNTGLPLQQQAVVHDPEAAGLEPGDFTVIVFVVQDFEPGTMDCDIGEAIPAGYVPDYTAGATTGIAGNIFGDDEGCHYEDVESGEFTCSVFNDLQPVEVIVEKIWIDDNPQFQQSTVVEVTLECDGPIIGGFPCLNGEGVNGNFCSEQFIDPNNPGEFLVLPHFDGTFCFATEEPIVGVLTDESDCEEMIVFPGQGDRCVIINTRLFAGIPTLNQYTLILLALLMLGIGMMAYRRFA